MRNHRRSEWRRPQWGKLQLNINMLHIFSVSIGFIDFVWGMRKLYLWWRVATPLAWNASNRQDGIDIRWIGMGWYDGIHGWMWFAQSIPINQFIKSIVLCFYVGFKQTKLIQWFNYLFISIISDDSCSILWVHNQFKKH